MTRIEKERYETLVKVIEKKRDCYWENSQFFRGDSPWSNELKHQEYLSMYIEMDIVLDMLKSPKRLAEFAEIWLSDDTTDDEEEEVTA